MHCRQKFVLETKHWSGHGLSGLNASTGLGKQGLAMIHTHYEKVISMEESVDVLLNTIQESWTKGLCFSSRCVTLKSIA